MPTSNFGKVAHVSPTPRATLQKSDNTCRTLEAACWLGMGAGATTLRIATLATVHSTAEYCAPAWCRSAHSVTPLRWPSHQRRLANRKWTPASYTSRQSSYPRWHPTRWASLQRIHTFSSMPCHGTWTYAPLSYHLHTEWECTSCQLETPISMPRTTTYLFDWRQPQRRGALVGSPMEYGVVGEHYATPHFPSLTSAPTHLEWLCKEQRGSGITPSAPVSDVSTPAYTNVSWPYCSLWVWRRRTDRWPCCPPPVSNPSTPMEGMTWRFWMTRISNGCLTPAPRSSAS